MNGIRIDKKISLLNINEFNFDEIKNINDYLFVFDSEVNKNIIIKYINIWKNKYPNFGLIFTQKGFLIDCSMYKFDILKKTNIIDDLHYQSIANGIISIKNEFINNFI